MCKSKTWRLILYGSDGPFGSKLKTEHYTERGIRVIRLQNIQEQYFNDDDKAYIDKKYYEFELVSYTVYPGDVLIAGLGDEHIRAGRACIMPENIDTAVNKADCFCLRLKPIINTKYLIAYLNCPFGLQQSESFSQGTTRFRLNLGNIQRMVIPVPSLEEQKYIVDILDSVYSSQLNAKTRYEQHMKYYKSTLLELL